MILSATLSQFWLKFLSTVTAFFVTGRKIVLRSQRIAHFSSLRQSGKRVFGKRRRLGESSGEPTLVKSRLKACLAGLSADLTIAPKPKDSVPIRRVFNQSTFTVREWIWRNTGLVVFESTPTR